jgi:hypothetical protein
MLNEINNFENLISNLNNNIIESDNKSKNLELSTKNIINDYEIKIKETTNN